MGNCSTAEPLAYFTTEQVAKILHYSRSWVTSHAKSLEGVKQKGKLYFPNRQLILNLGARFEKCFSLDEVIALLKLPYHRLIPLRAALGAFTLFEGGRLYFPKEKVLAFKEQFGEDSP